MKRELVEQFLHDNAEKIADIKSTAGYLHDVDCNQKYGNGLPYSFHLNMVADYAMKWLHLVCMEEKDIIPIIFGAYFHDAIEDARQTYNDITELAKQFMDKNQALTATEIVYALTDEKGRNRAERGSEKHYADIRDTLYAPFVKFCDRFANAQFSANDESRMLDVYNKEMHTFVERLGGTKFIPNELVVKIFDIHPTEEVDNLIKEETKKIRQ